MGMSYSMDLREWVVFAVEREGLSRHPTPSGGITKRIEIGKYWNPVSE
jgi:hypothetical protein